MSLVEPKRRRRHLLAQRYNGYGAQRGAGCGFERAQAGWRFPDLIVRAQSNDDVVAAVRQKMPPLMFFGSTRDMAWSRYQGTSWEARKTSATKA